MYEMYPDSWLVDADRAAEQPRRRARKEHTVVPAVLAQATAVDGQARIRAVRG